MEALSLPHLSSPLPVPLRVLVPGWCFLVTAAAVSMCDGFPAASGWGPFSVLHLGHRAVELVHVPSLASVSSVCAPLMAGRGLWPLSHSLPHAALLTGWGVHFSLPGQGLRSWLGKGWTPMAFVGWRFGVFYLHLRLKILQSLKEVSQPVNAEVPPHREGARPVKPEQPWASSSLCCQKQQLQLWG